MAASVQLRSQNRDLGMVMREVDEDLAIFLGLKNDHLFIDHLSSTEAKPDTPLIAKAVEMVADDSLLNLEIESQRSDYDWLTPDAHDLAANTTDISKDERISQKPEVTNSCANSRPSSSRDRKANSRASTPTRRPSLPAKPKSSRASTPTSRATLEPSRASSRATSTSSKPVGAQVRSSTPSRAASRSSTPSSRPIISKSGSRSATPTRKPEATQSTISSSDKSSGGRKTSIKIPQIVKSRPSKPSEILSVSHDAPQNPKVCMSRRPASASRGRPTTQAAKPRQRSCSPAKVRASNGTTRASTGTTAHKIMLSRSRSYNHGGGDDVNPVLMGTKMVERVVNMRKLAPPKQDERVSLDNTKKTSQENSGFGRSLSKRSLDMAIRHMDIRRSITDSLSPVATSSSSSNQSSSYQSSTVGFSDSSSTSTSDSSKSSNCGNSYFLDGRRMDD